LADALAAAIERALDESKHLVTFRDTSSRDRALDRHHKLYPHDTTEKEEKRTAAAIAAAVGAVNLAGGMSTRLTQLFTQAERYLAEIKKHDTFLAGVDRHDPFMRASIRTAEYGRSLARSRYTSTMEAARQDLREAWERSYRMGIRSSGVWKSPRLAASESSWVRQAARREMSFFNQLIDDVKAGKPVQSLRSRIAMYGKAILAAYTAGQVAATGRSTLIHWLLDPQAEHCDDCIALAKNGPYVKDTLPTTPRAGLCKCRCIVTPSALVLTVRGEVPIADVRVGDLVWTHRSRWRAVLATPRTSTTSTTAGAVARGITFTADHKFWTLDGWVPLIEVAERQLQMVHLQYAEILQQMLGPYALGSPVEHLPTVRDLLSNLRCWSEGSESLGVSVMRQAPQGIEAVGIAGEFAQDSSGPAPFWVGSPETFRGFDSGQLHQLEGEGRETVGSVLGREEVAARLSLPVGVDTPERSDPSWYGCAPQKWQLHGRPAVQLGVASQVGSPVDSWPGCSESITPCSIVEGTTLYDLTVDEDHSFVVEGMIVSNSNCKCRLEFEAVSAEAAEAVRQGNYSKRYLLDKIRRGGWRQG
jgi:hypothetical protein